MALKAKKKTPRDIMRARIFYEVINDPILFAELCWIRQNAIDGVTGKVWKTYPMRLAPLLATRHSSHLFDGSGRNQSKSEQIKAAEIKHFPFRNILKRRPRQAMFLCPNEVHRKALDNSIVEMQRDPLFKLMIRAKREDPQVKVDFNDGSILYGVIPGLNGRNFPGIHVDEIIGDEACLFTHENLAQLGGCKNPGVTEHWYGTKNGDNASPMYLRDTDPDFGYYRRFAIPSTAHPYYSMLRAGMIQDFGKPGTQDWVQNVLARWGQPTNYAFNEVDVEHCFQRGHWYEHIEILEKNVRVSKQDPRYREVDQVFRVPVDAPRYNDVIIGWDPGENEDSEITVWGSEDGNTQSFVMFLRLTIKGVRLDYQMLILDKLCCAFNPISLGIDIGGAGKPIANMMEGETRKGMEFGNYRNIVVNVQFGESINIGTEDAEVNEYVKKVAVDYLSGMLFSHALRFCDLQFKADLQSFWFTINPQGRYIYKKSKDHLICSALAFAMAHRSRYYKDERKKKQKFIGIIPIFGAA